jgi:hypothetical protein
MLFGLKLLKRPMHCLCTAYSLPIHFLFTSYPLSIHCLFTAYSLSRHSVSYAACSPSIHCPFTACSPSIHCLFPGMTGELGGSERVQIQLPERLQVALLEVNPNSRSEISHCADTKSVKRSCSQSSTIFWWAQKRFRFHVPRMPQVGVLFCRH